MIERIDLFPTSIYKTRIDPSLWNKEKFVNESIQSYNIDPNRHAKDMPDSEFHTTYKDWNNPKFNSIDTDDLQKVYSKTISEFFNSLKLKCDINYSWSVVNISIGKDNWYDWHCHGGIPSKEGYVNNFVMVHYIKFDEKVHNSTCFKNPLIMSLFKNNLILRHIMNDNHIEHSTYRSNCALSVVEDDVIIFPSYLYHGVLKKNSNTEKFRIITSTHLDIKYDEGLLYG
jgi:hypothetical protein